MVRVLVIVISLIWRNNHRPDKIWKHFFLVIIGKPSRGSRRVPTCHRNEGNSSCWLPFNRPITFKSGVYCQSYSCTKKGCWNVGYDLQRNEASPWALLTSMSSTNRFPSRLNWFVNGAVWPFCAAYNVPLKKWEKRSIPFYPVFCHSVHLGKSITCMIRRILKEKPDGFSI